MILETSRLFLRRQYPADFRALYEILSDPHTMRYYPSPFSPELVAKVLARNIELFREQGIGLFGVLEKERGYFMGECGITFQNIDGKIVPEIGYQLHKRFWRQGYATEAAEACLAYGFTCCSFPEIYIHTYTENVPSRRVAEKLGLTYVKEYDKTCNGGRVMPHVVYVMSRHDWKG